MIRTTGLAAFSAKGPLAPHSFERRAVGPRDVAIDILYCGICHSDLHFAHGDWGPIPYPAIPGHEIIGTVTKIGAEVSRFREGQTVGVGCMVDSCRTCASCGKGLEQYCDTGATYTYGGVEKQTGQMTLGGYARAIVVDQDFVLRIPEGLDLAAAAPLLCAGITTYSPLRHWNVGPGQQVGVVGLGGLGHMAIKIAKAMGAEVTLFTTSASKGADAKRLGADHVVVSTDEAAMKAVANRYDLILNTVAAPHDLATYIVLLKLDGTMVLVGAPAEPHKPLHAGALFSRRRTVAGSLIGGVAETQEMLDFCAAHGIVSDIELIDPSEINTAWDRLLKSDVKYRFVLDMQKLDASA